MHVRLVPLAVASITIGLGFLFAVDSIPPGTRSLSRKGPDSIITDLTRMFVPNLGQWKHPAALVLRDGPMTMFLEDRGWRLSLMERRPACEEERGGPGGFASRAARASPSSERVRGVALRMSFEGAARAARPVGQEELPGRHNYFLGSDRSRWRTDVPLYGSVLYKGLYPGIDVRLRHEDGHPEYDLMLAPDADLGAVSVRVDGAEGLRIAVDGGLVIETALGPVSQPLPRTWQTGTCGQRKSLVSHYVLLGPDRFGFQVAGWDGRSRLTIDPGLLWSTYLGGKNVQKAWAVSVGDNGVVTLAGSTESVDFPTTPGAYDTTFNRDAFVSRLDPTKNGTAQLIYSTFLGGTGGADAALSLSVDASSMVTVAGQTRGNFPTTSGAYDTTFNGGFYDAFVSTIDPSRRGTAQLVYSTLLGGFSEDWIRTLVVDSAGIVTVAGGTWSSDFPTTSGAFATLHSGGPQHGREDGFVSRLDPSKTGSAQLVYSTYLGGEHYDSIHGLSVDAGGVITVAGVTYSSKFPTTASSYDSTHNGNGDAFITRLDARKTGKAQLVYSTYLGGSSDNDAAFALFADTRRIITVAGSAASPEFPTTAGAYDTTLNAGLNAADAFVSRLDLTKMGAAQLVYSTFLGGSDNDFARTLSVDPSGIVTVVGATLSSSFPTTAGAHDTSHNGKSDVFVSRLDPARTGTAQLLYSTLLGGSDDDQAGGLSVDPSGVATVAGWTRSSSTLTNFPATTGAYDTSFNGLVDAFVSRIAMGVPLWADVHQLSLKLAGTQTLTLNAGKQHAGRLYWIFGSVTGTSPGVDLGGVHFPLNPDVYTDFTFAFANSPTLKSFRGTLGNSGTATASFNVPSGLPSLPSFTLYHAYVVYDTQRQFYMVSNAVPLHLKK